MAVERRKTSRFWYGRWQRDGRRILKRLAVEVAGQPGSKLFNASKTAAEEELSRLIRDFEAKHRPEDLVQRVHELRFGRKVGATPLKHLAESWEKLPRRTAISKARLTYGRRVLGDFVRFVDEQYPAVSSAFESAAPVGNYDEEQADQVILLNSSGSFRRLWRLGNGTWYDTQTKGATSLILQPGQAYYYIRRTSSTTGSF